MTEHIVFIEEEFLTDIDINFCGWSNEQKIKLIEAITNGETFTFEGVSVCYSGDTTVDINEENK